MGIQKCPIPWTVKDRQEVTNLAEDFRSGWQVYTVQMTPCIALKMHLFVLPFVKSAEFSSNYRWWIWLEGLSSLSSSNSWTVKPQSFVCFGFPAPKAFPVVRAASATSADKTCTMDVEGRIARLDPPVDSKLNYVLWYQQVVIFSSFSKKGSGNLSICCKILNVSYNHISGVLILFSLNRNRDLYTGQL